jgi:hypothetical protein
VPLCHSVSAVAGFMIEEAMGDDKLFPKIWNRARLYFGNPNLVSDGGKGGHEIQKTMNRDFLSRKPLISLISAKNKFAKIWRAK